MESAPAYEPGPLPNVFYIGMGKSGSTLIHKLFLRHPDICVTEDSKEVNFFGNFQHWSLGVDWYRNAFRNHKGEQYVADISPGYHIKPQTMDRLAATVGTDVRLIFTFRQFTNFAYSRYLQKVRSRRLPASFLDELEGKGNFYRPLGELLERYFEQFGAENFLIMEYEKHFKRDDPKFEPAIYEFLDLPSGQSYYAADADESVNAGYTPRFVFAEDGDIEEERDGVVYRVPQGTLVYCNGRGYQNTHWTDPRPQVVEQATAAEKLWTKKMDTELYAYVQEKYTLPLAADIKARLGIDLSYWDVPPREIAYPPAPLPDAYIVSGGDAVHATTPWG